MQAFRRAFFVPSNVPVADVRARVYPLRVARTQTVVVERPPEGPARGKWESPSWVIVVITAVAVVATIGYAVWRLWRPRKPAP